MEKDIISLLFEKKEEEDMFKFKDDELIKKRDIKKKTKKELLNFISHRVHPKTIEHLESLLEQYCEASSEYFYCEEKAYYKQGILDGLSIKFNK